MAVDKIVWNILLDIFVLACAGFPLLAMMLWAEPYHRGYFENDESLMLPFKQETISAGLLGGLGFAFVVLTILITEIVRDKRGKNVGEKFLSGSLVPGWIWESYSTIGVFSFGAACQQLTTNLTKYVIGRLRPHFLDVLGWIWESYTTIVVFAFGAACQQLPTNLTKYVIGRLRPHFLDAGSISSHDDESYTTIEVFAFGAACQQLPTNLTKYVIGRLRPHLLDVCKPIVNQTSPLNQNGYIQDFMCMGQDQSLFKDMRLSFPSAHACFSMYCAVFFICYVQVKGKWRGSKLFRHGIQYAVVLAAWYVGLTRVQEHYHHWSDIAAGYLIGAIYAVLVFVYVLKPKKYGLPTAWNEEQPNVLPRAALQR